MEYATTTDPRTGKPLVEFQCPSCGTGQREALSDAGNPSTCGQCGASFRIPGEAEAAKLAPSRRAKPQSPKPEAGVARPTSGRVSDMHPDHYRQLIREAVASGVLGGLLRWTGLMLLLAVVVGFLMGVLSAMLNSGTP